MGWERAFVWLVSWWGGEWIPVWDEVLAEVVAGDSNSDVVEVSGSAAVSKSTVVSTVDSTVVSDEDVEEAD